MSFMDPEKISGAPVRETRRARLLRGTLRFANGREIPIVVRNVSDRGLGITCKTAPPGRGDVVSITLPGSTDLHAIVRWTRETSFGVELQGSVDHAEIAEALKRSKQTTDWEVSRRHRVNTLPNSTPRRLV